MIHLRRLFSLLLSLSMILLPLGSAQASLVGNGQLVNQAERGRLLQLLDREDAQRQLSALGINPEQAQQRVMRMTDQEVAQINQRLTDLPAGGDVLGALLVVFIVFIITDVIGATNIFTFVHPVK